MNGEVFALKIQEDMRTVERAGLAAAKRAAFRIRRAVLTEYQKGMFINIRPFYVMEMYEPLLKSMMILHLKGIKFAQSLVPRINFSQRLDNILNRLADPATIRRLSRRYQTQVLRTLYADADGFEKEIRGFVTDLVRSGVPVRRGVRELNNKFESLGISQRSPHRLENLYRTQSQIAHNAGRWQQDQDPLIQEILWGYRYATVGDARVRDTHAALEGTTLPKEDPFWNQFWPPNGYQCRCVAIPIFERVEIQVPPSVVPGTNTRIVPDAGFAFNPGQMLAI